MAARWTDADDVTLIDMMRDGVTQAAIAARLGRTLMAVQFRCVALRARGFDIPAGHAAYWTARRLAGASAAAKPPISRPPRKTRPCLGGCGRQVVRDGIQFLCPHCRTRSAGPFDTPAVVRYR